MKKFNVMVGGDIGVNGTPLEPQKVVELLNKGELLKDKVNNAKNCLVASAIADPMEVCENTLAILDS